ncbi:MAG: hypothetical protein H7245_16110 [Candidatus Saccharibacteria bacterium]|nr:hypothetical protein [Pseudorhodobacter sp.]
MSSEHRNTWVGLISSLLVNSYFLWRIWGMLHDGTSTAPNGLQIWAQTVLWVVPVSIGLTIALTILANITVGLLTVGPKPVFLTDERDRQFEFWGLGATMLFMIAGFLLAMVLLAAGYGGFIAFNVIYLAMALGDLAGNLLKLILYQVR